MKTEKLLWIIFLLLTFNLLSQEEEKTFTWEEAQQTDPLLVTRLSLRKMKLTELPEELKKYKNLQLLDLSKNRLKELPLYFIEFDSLRILKIEQNKMPRFPVAVCQLVRLEELWAYDNYFTGMPNCIGNLKHLRIIDLSDNLIESLPEELAQLPRLEKLLLNGMTLNKYFQKSWSEKLPKVKIEFGQPCDCMSH